MRVGALRSVFAPPQESAEAPALHHPALLAPLQLGTSGRRLRTGQTRSCSPAQCRLGLRLWAVPGERGSGLGLLRARGPARARGRRPAPRPGAGRRPGGARPPGSPRPPAAPGRTAAACCRGCPARAARRRALRPARSPTLSNWTARARRVTAQRSPGASAAAQDGGGPRVRGRAGAGLAGARPGRLGGHLDAVLQDAGGEAVGRVRGDPEAEARRGAALGQAAAHALQLRQPRWRQVHILRTGSCAL
jgi:hypothetical protein